MSIYQKKSENGTIIKNKKGNSWYYRCYYTDIYGQRKQRQSKMFETKREAQEEERKFLDSINNNTITKNKTLRDLYYAYYDYKKDKVKETSLHAYPYKFTTLEPLADIKLKDFSMVHYENWKKWVNEKDWKIGYKNGCYKFLKSILNFGIKYYDLNSLSSICLKMEGFSNPDEIKEERHIYSLEQYNQFISNEKELKWKVLFDTMFFMGLRKGELRGLQWKHIDFEKGTMNIVQQIPSLYDSRKYKITSLKTPNSERCLPIDNSILNELKDLYDIYSSYTNFTQDWFVYGDILPTPIYCIKTRIDKLYELSDLPYKLTAHEFRHSCASFLINNGLPVNLVSKYLGHSKPTTTLNIYTHLFENQFDDIKNLIDKMKK